MDHSVRGYLERQSDFELQCTIRYCLNQEDLQHYGQFVLMGIHILESRYPDRPEHIDKVIKAFWEELICKTYDKQRK